ncbi:hypothetical protein RD792_006846, partial [Penstemon davidsonii]
KSSLKRKRNSGLVLSRVWLCAREGFRSERIKDYDRKREAKVESRCGCKASFRVAIDNYTGEYKVTRFEPQNNHPLETSDTSHRLRCNRFRPSHVMDFVEKLGGGSASGVFNRKDGYNYLNSQRLKRIEGGDVNTVLGLLEGMKLKDESLRFKYTVDGNGALTRLFWCDGMSRAEYEQFGDVVLFDSTYKINIYRFPIVLFSGVNCHLCTCIFGIAILYSETIESYRWLLQTFRESMNGKSSIAVLTDHDASMRAAVLHEFPEAKHRLCCWHISRNAESNIKTGDFSTMFSKLMKRPCPIDEFEERWSELIEEYGVTNHQWVLEIYSKRNQWAEAFFRGQFISVTNTLGDALGKLGLGTNRGDCWAASGRQWEIPLESARATAKVHI